MTPETDIQTRAAEWILARDRFDDEAGLRAKFEAWLAADARHRTAYLELDRAWRVADGLKTWRPHDGGVDPDVLRRSRSRRVDSTRRYAMAAMLLVAVMAGAWGAWFAWTADVYGTGKGEFRRVLLADGSLLQLNTDTRVRVRLAKDRRVIELLRGEGHFTVAHDTSRPFDVIAAERVIRAVGTAFTVRIRNPEDVEVVVTEGTVTLSSSATGDPAEKPAPISAMHVARAQPQAVSVKPVAVPEMSRLLAWQTGELIFDDVTLGEAVAEFNRYNNRQLVIADPHIAALRVGGNFHATDLDAFVRALGASFGIEAQASAQALTLHRPGGE